MQKKPELKIKLEKNEKTNKLELKIKQEGQKTRKYAWEGIIPTKEYIKQYEKTNQKTANRKEWYKTKKKYEQKWEKQKKENWKQHKKKNYPKIKDIIAKGNGITIIKNATNKTENQIEQHNKQLLRPLVKDKLLLKVLSEENNQQKIKTGITHTIYLKEGKKTLAVLKTSNKTIRETIKELKKATTKNMEIKDSYLSIKEKLGTKYKYNHKNNGKLNNITITTKYKKGR